MTTKTRSTLRLALLGVAAVTTLAYVRSGRHPQVMLSRDRSPASTAARTAAADQPAAAAAQSGDVLVDWKDDVDPAVIEKTARDLGVTIEPNSKFSGPEKLTRIHGVRGRVKELIARLRGRADVENVEPDILYKALPVGAPEAFVLPAELTAPPSGDAKNDAEKFPNDPQYKFQWHLDQIGMPAAWPKTQGEGVVVAVIDTGVAFRDRGRFKRVPDLAQTQFVPGYNFVAKNENPEDDHGHGTHVAGTIAQSTNNGIGVAGIAYKAKIMPVKVLSAQGSGSVADIAEAIRWSADHGAQVINMSLGGPIASRILAKAIEYAHKKGVTVVCAAGNDGSRRVGWPAAAPHAIAVAATQYDETTTFYSNYGPEIDVAAPGGNVRVDQNGDGMPDGVLQNTIKMDDPSQDQYVPWMGTSMASPHVAGVAALIVSRGVTDPDAVERILKETARAPKASAIAAAGRSVVTGAGRHDDRYGYGIIDAPAAIKAATMGHGTAELGLGGLIALVIFGRLALGGQLGIRLGLGSVLALVMGASGLYFLPYLLPDAATATVGVSQVVNVASHAVPAWGQTLVGSGVNLLGFSALLPLMLAVAAYGVPRLRGVLACFALGAGAQLLYQACFGLVTLRFLPLAGWLTTPWLVLNGLFLLAVSYLIARK
jgi:serine protease